ncbi:alpha/beta hydrolase [Solirubrobacter ginsenosidimutans]|uniref:Alpha/beta hydrolase n=1 Tax=Solirubrobacter ginsenosidimutans TaxID=490573 RepID=A0A9X3SBC4_9ACTN|nr:alpha/beta hydrolase [Solirubrobacter ginsenosidimutans]MDA0166873.1 alpha/beta hydrolase [Solirubrobacter ginsenosidimutans]
MELNVTAGDGPPVLFLHGALVDRTLWDPVIALLPDRRCIAPTLPLGSHRAPVADRSTLTPIGVADQIADLIAEQGLTDLTVVASDTGGALLQLLLARRPEGIARVIFTPCDALEVFPPALFKPLFLAGRSPLALAAFLSPLRIPGAWRLPIGFGWLTKRATNELVSGWAAPALGNFEIVRDGAHFLRHVEPGLLLDAAPKLRDFEGEAIFCWPSGDRAFKVELGRRLAAQFRDARFIEIEDSYSFVSIDRPDALAPLI